MKRHVRIIRMGGSHGWRIDRAIAGMWEVGCGEIVSREVCVSCFFRGTRVKTGGSNLEEPHKYPYLISSVDALIWTEVQLDLFSSNGTLYESKLVTSDESDSIIWDDNNPIISDESKPEVLDESNIDEFWFIPVCVFVWSDYR